MKKSNLLLSLLMAVTFLAFTTACEEDPVVVPPSEGLPVADGFYFTQVGVDPVATSQLKASTVDAPSFGAMTREGFVQGYAYLTAGSYNMVEVVEKAIVNTYGGASETVTDVVNEECDASGYTLVKAAVDGAAFTIATDGLYVIAYDATMAEIIYDQITSAGIIGAATPGGWGGDTELNTTASITADGAEWTLEGVTIDVGQMKFRYNCRWAIDRRIDTGVDFDNTNGYSFFTNYGNTLDLLQPGNEGPNIEMVEYAVYTVVFAWDPIVGVTASATKTEEAEPKPEYPAELYVVGGSLGGWDWAANGVQLTPVHSNPHLFWAILWLDNDTDTPLSPADPGLKFSPISSWDDNFGVDAGAGETSGVWGKGGDNFPGITTSGYYMVVVNLEAGAETVEVNRPLIYGVGSAFDWDFDASYLFTEDVVNKVMTSPAFIMDGDVRMYTTATTMTPVSGGPDVEWWQAEFNVFSGIIEYRAGGGDQAAVPVTLGQTVSLNFKEGTGTFQ